MISNREIANLAGEWQLAQHVVEKDYVLSWMLAGIAEHRHTRSWAFKGGTCLRKCWFETYRFSEDLDFTVTEGDLDFAHLSSVFVEIAEWVDDACGLRLIVDDRAFRRRKNKRGHPTVEGRIAYIGPLGTPTPPKVKLDLTADEVLVRELERKPVLHPFSDSLTSATTSWPPEVACYSLPELLGEKIRALAERCRPRYLYDVVHAHRHPDLVGRGPEVVEVLKAKCVHATIDMPTLKSIRATPFRNEIETEWSNMLGHQLMFLPKFEDFWSQLHDVFAWLQGAPSVDLLAEIQPAEVVTDWRPARHITSWREAPTLELNRLAAANRLKVSYGKFAGPLQSIRFAGANRLKVTIDYRPMSGRVGPRTVEPYSLRYSKQGDLLVMVVNDLDQVRSYRADRILDVRIEPESFTPRYLVEF